MTNAERYPSRPFGKQACSFNVPTDEHMLPDLPVNTRFFLENVQPPMKIRMAKILSRAYRRSKVEALTDCGYGCKILSLAPIHWMRNQIIDM